MDGSWATVVPAAADALPRPTTAAGASTRLTARGLAGRLFAALRQGVRRQTPVAAETLEADETCRTSTQMDLEADLQPQRESRQVNSGKEDEELELLLADIAAQTALLQQEMREGGLRKCEAEVQISHTELQKQKIARQLLEEQLKTLECQLLDSTEKEEIRSLLKDLAAQTSACAKAQEQVQKALKDMEELGAENGAVKVDEGMESTTQLQDMLVELQPSNDAVKALLKTSCDHLHRQRIEREILEAKLRSMECQLSDATKQDELKTLLRNFALYTAVNLKAEAAIQAVLNDLEALKASKDLEVAIASFMGDAKAVAAKAEEAPKGATADATNSGEAQAAGAKDDLLERIELHEAMLNCESSKALGDCQRVPDSGAAPPESAGQVAIASFMGDAKAAVAAKAEEAPKGASADATNSLAPNSAGDSAAAPVEVPRPVAAAHRYDLKEPRAFAQFLQDADIRLIRAKYLHDLAQSKRPLPRRQEAELCNFEFDGKAESALVSHAEVQNWAAGARTATICSVSHAWETREHPDPCRYQLQLIADRAAWYEAAFETDVWIFYDFTSLFQYERLLSEEERSFRAAMANMHIMYAHECTMTFIIEHLTPTDVWESTMKNDQELIPVWDDKLQSIKSKPLNCLIENRTEYLERGWCIGEISWSSLRTHNSQSQRIDWLGSDQVEPGQGQGLTGKVPLTPDKFKERMKRAKFTHRDKDLPIVVELQEKIFDEKVAVCEHLVLKGLPEQEIFALAEALPLYRSLRTLKLDTFQCSEEAAEAFGKALATSQIVSLELRNPRQGSGALMGKAVFDALTTNQSLTSISAEDESIFDVAAKKALAKALRKNRSIKDRLPLDAPVRLKVVADALERNSLGTSVTVDPAEDQIDDQKAKAVAQLLKSGSPVKSIDLGNTCISDDGAQALAEALRCNRTLEVLCLHEDQITDVGAKALAEALEVNKTLRSLTMGFYEALRTVEEMKRGRGDDFRFFSTEDKKEAERCDGNIFRAARDGNVRAVRHLLRMEPSSMQQTGHFGDTPLHNAAQYGKTAVVELLLAANAPVDAQNDNGLTPLHKAACKGRAEVVQLLLTAKAQVDVQKNDGQTPLHVATAEGHVEVVKLLVEVASLAVQDELGDTPLHDAVHKEVVELLLAANAPVDVQSKKGWTPLHSAARNGLAEVVQLLLTAKAQVDVQTNDGQTPLHLAAYDGHVEVVKLLVEVASLGVQNEDGDTPLHDAARKEVVELLLAANAPVDVQSKKGWTPLHSAARNGLAEVVQLLLTAKAQVDVQKNDGDTPLHQAAFEGNTEVVELLVAANAPLDVQNKRGWTPLHSAARNGLAEVVQLLLTAKAQVDVQTNDGDTPLHNAAYKGSTEVVELLLAANAPVDVQNNGGDTPLHDAVRNGKAEVVELLLAANAPVDVKSNGGWTLLHRAALNGHAEVVQLLPTAKAQVDVQKNDGQTPLHVAAASANGHVEVVKLLVEVASLGVQDNSGDTPLHDAAAEGETAVVELLLAANAPVDVQNKKGKTPLDLARAAREAEVVQLLEAAQAVAPPAE